jgi:hypothetical protein
VRPTRPIQLAEFDSRGVAGSGARASKHGNRCPIIGQNDELPLRQTSE